jgi:hypothetical protein
LGAYYLSKEDFNESALWYYNAAFEVSPALNIEAGGGIPLAALAECYEKWADSKEAALNAIPILARSNFAADLETIATLRQNAADYRKQAEEWMLPQL